MTYPAVVARAESQGAEIAWGDESGLRSDAQVGQGYAPQGQTPEINLSQRQRHRLNLSASVSNQGLVRFMLYAGKLDSWVFIVFLVHLIQQRERKLFWIVDNHPVDHAWAVQQWLSEHQTQIELVFLPWYSPQLNPVEHLNGDVLCREFTPKRRVAVFNNCIIGQCVIFASYKSYLHE